MKNIFLLFIISINLYGQDTKFFFKKRDTLYIIIDENMRLDYTQEMNGNIIENNKIVGVKTTYNVFSDTIKRGRDVYKKKELDDYNRGVVVSRFRHSHDFGMDFIKITSNLDYLLKSINQKIKIYNNVILSKDNCLKDLKDTIAFDKKVYSHYEFNNETGLFNSITLSTDHLQKLNTFYLDKTHEKFIDLQKIVKEKPYVLFFCRKTIGKYQSNGPVWFLFDEVVYRKKY